ncbi:MAG: lysine biosynthesis protein LysW [Candidatus Taylorbacteria bacterium]|nr:lysine biosynthesis protein LysW [Candidatus Taylorbacteria bacterium]
MEQKTLVCVCPECKNMVDLSRYPNLKVGDVIECQTCGVTLEVKNIGGGQVEVDIVDEGK